MALERDPNSKNLFYVDPELFPITNSMTGNTIDLDESTGKFTFSIRGTATIALTADVGESLAGKTLRLYLQRDLFNSISYVRVRFDDWSRTYDDTNIDGHPTLSGEEFVYWEFELGSSVTSTSVTLEMPLINSMLNYVGPQGIALTLESDPLSEWESAYREAKIDLDPALSSKLITVGQLSRLTGSGTASGAQGSDLVTMAQLAKLMGKAAPPDDQKDKLVTVGQAYSVV